MNIINILMKSELSRKIDLVNEKFNSLVNKYIGDGVGAMVVVLLLVIIAIIIVRNFAKK